MYLHYLKKAAVCNVLLMLHKKKCAWLLFLNEALRNHLIIIATKHLFKSY